MDGERNHFRSGVLVSLVLHLLAVLFVFALGVGKSGTVRMERSIEVSLQTYEPRTDEKPTRAERKKRPRPPEKKKPPARAKAQEKKKTEPAPPEKPPEVAKKPPAVKKPVAEKERKPVKETVAEKKPAPAKKPPEKKTAPEPPEKTEPPKERETASASPEKTEPRRERNVPAPDAGKREVIRDMRKESVIRKLRESPAAAGESEEPPAQQTPVSRAEPSPPVPKERKPEGEADSESAVESIRKNPEGAVADRAPAETSPRVISLVLDVYYRAISGRIEENLILPLNVEPRGLMTALVSFRMRQSGEVYDVGISESSGNDIFDSYCIKAVNASSPLPVPPSELRGRIRSEPFVVPCKNRR